MWLRRSNRPWCNLLDTNGLLTRLRNTKLTKRVFGDARGRRLSLQPLEPRRLLAFIGLEVNLLEDNGGTPGDLIADDLLSVGQSFFAEITVQSIDEPSDTEQAGGVFSLQLDVGWDPAVLQEIDDPFIPQLVVAPVGFTAFFGQLDNDQGEILALAAGTTALSLAVGGDVPERFYLLYFRAESPATDSLFSITGSGGLADLSNPNVHTQMMQAATFTVEGGAAAELNINDPVLTEGTGGTTNLSFDVGLTQILTSEISVDFSVAGGTAQESQDYTISTTSPILFAPGETGKTIDLVVNADSTVELDETVVIELSNIVVTNDSAGIAGPDAVLGDGIGTGTISNDDTAQIFIAEPVVSASEATGQLDFVIDLTNPVDVDVSVDFNTSDGSATVADSDYVATSNTLVFLAGQSDAMTVPITVIDDNKLELNETLTLAISNLGHQGRTVSLGTASATGEIVNADVDDIANLTITDVTQDEGDSGESSLFSFAVQLDNPVDAEVSVQFTTSDGTALVADGDYESTSGVLTFPAGSTASQMVDVTVHGDDDPEATETFSVDLFDLQDAGRGVGLEATATGTIVADDTAIFIDDVTLSEGDSGQTTFVFNVTASGVPAGQSIEVIANTTDGSASATNGDYEPVENTVLTFDDQTATQTVTVFVNGDTFVENDETFHVTIATDAVGITLADDTGLGTITNDEIAEISVNGVTVTEGDSATTVDIVFDVTLSAPVDVAVSLDLATVDGTAQAADDDYVASSQTITFPATDNSTQMFTVTVNGDNTVELTESFEISLTNLDVAGRNVVLNDELALGTINNDDTATMSVSDVTVSEGADGETATLPFAVLLDRPVDVEVNIDFTTNDQTALLADGDYQSTSGTLTFAAGTASTQTIDVITNGDNRVESNETLKMILHGLEASGRDVTLSQANAIGSIENDDEVVVLIDDVQVSEGDSGTGVTEVTVRLTGPVDEQVSVDFTTVDGSGLVVDGDYFTNSGTVTFDPGSTSELIPITVQGDLKYELDETLKVVLSNLQVGNSNVSIQDAEAILTVNNDDNHPDIQIDSVYVNEPENDSVDVIFTVNLSNPSYETVTVDYATVDVSAQDETGEGDYLSASGTLTFDSQENETQQTISVQVNADDNSEAIETFQLLLSNAEGGTIVQGNDDGIGTISEDSGTASLSGYVTLAGFSPSTLGIPGVTVTAFADNLPHSISTFTDANGYYEFDSLFADDNYEIVQSNLDTIFVNGLDTIGTQGGEVEEDRLFNISLDAGEVGSDNTFTVQSLQPSFISKRLLLNSTPSPQQFLTDLMSGTTAGSTNLTVVAGPPSGITGFVSPQVIVDQDTVTVVGTDGYDEFEFQVSADELIVTINQEVHTLAAEQVSEVLFTGGGGADRATLIGGDGDEHVELFPHSATLHDADLSYFVEVSEVDQIVADGGDGHNTAVLFDSIGDDTLQIQPNLARMSMDDLCNQVVNFDLVRAVSRAGNTDLLRGADRADFVLQLEGNWRDAARMAG